STPVITLLGWAVTERIVARRFPDAPSQAVDDESPQGQRLSAAERRGMRYAVVAFTAFTLVLVWALLPSGTLPGAGFLRNPETGSLLTSPFLSGVVAIIFLYGVIAGIAYGVG